MKREVKETDVYIKNADDSVSVKRMMATVTTIDANDNSRIVITKEQARLIRILPKNSSDWRSIWERHLLRNNLDPVTIARIIEGEDYDVMDSYCN